MRCKLNSSSKCPHSSYSRFCQSWVWFPVREPKKIFKENYCEKILFYDSSEPLGINSESFDNFFLGQRPFIENNFDVLLEVSQNLLLRKWFMDLDHQWTNWTKPLFEHIVFSMSKYIILRSNSTFIDCKKKNLKKSNFPNL